MNWSWVFAIGQIGSPPENQKTSVLTKSQCRQPSLTRQTWHLDITLSCSSPQWQASQCPPVTFSGSSFTLICLIFLRGWKSVSVSCGESAIFTGSATAVLTKLLAGSAQGTFVQDLTLLALDCATLDPSGWQVALKTPLSLHWWAIGLKQPYNCEQILISWTCAP